MPPIEVVVGEGAIRKTFYIDEGALKSGGEFFVAALKEEWRKYKAPISLPEDDPKAFEVYAQWLYTGKIFSRPFSDSRAAAFDSQNFGLLTALYVLGDRLMDSVFQDRIMDAIVAMNVQTTMFMPAQRLVDFICGRIPAHAAMRRWLVQWYARWSHNDLASGDGWRDMLKIMNHEFLADLVVEMSRQARMSNEDRDKTQALLKSPGCTFHHHIANEPCGRSQII